MGRPSKPFFRKQTQTWYTTVDGRQRNLGKDKQEAMREWHSIQSTKNLLTEKESDQKVLTILNEFLENCEKHSAPDTYAWYCKFIKPFAKWLRKKGLANLRACQLKPFHLTKYTDSRFSSDKKTSRRNCIRAIQRPFFWANEEGYLSVNPVVRVKKPEVQTREVYITPEQWKVTFDALPKKNDPFRDMLVFLRYTGCRPQEVKIIEAKYYDPTNFCFVIPKDKSKGRKHQRVILVSREEAQKIVARLLVKYPQGPIFRNTDGNPWENAAISSRVNTLKKKVGFRLPPIAFRHAFCTDMLIAGMDPIELSEVMGHRDLTMIKRVYNHLKLKRQHLHDRLKVSLDKAHGLAVVG